LVQPYLVIFCPKASEALKEGLHSIYGKVEGWNNPLGYEFVNKPLYEAIRGREPFSYHVQTVEGVGASANLTFEDFYAASEDFFEGKTKLKGLRDYIWENPTAASDGVRILALSYTIADSMSEEEFDRVCILHPNAMTANYATYLKEKIKAKKIL
jgi:hypothetical protein